MSKFAFFFRLFVSAAVVAVMIMGYMIWQETSSRALSGQVAGQIDQPAANPIDEASAVSPAEANPSNLTIEDLAKASRTWSEVRADGRGSLNIFTVDPSDQATIYVGTAAGTDLGQGSIWRSTDNGRSWYEFGLSLPGNAEGIVPAVSALAIDPTEPDALYVGTWGQGLYRYFLDESGYQRILNVTFPDMFIKGLVPDPNGGLYVFTNERGLLHMRDATWRSFESLPSHAISLAVNSAGTIYAGTVPMGIYRSDDDGQTWQNISEGLGLTPGLTVRVTALTVDAENPMHLAAATAFDIGSQTVAGGLYQSFDAGNSWQKVTDLSEVTTALTMVDGNIYSVAADKLKQLSGPEPAELLSPFDILMQQLDAIGTASGS